MFVKDSRTISGEEGKEEGAFVALKIVASWGAEK